MFFSFVFEKVPYGVPSYKYKKNKSTSISLLKYGPSNEIPIHQTQHIFGRSKRQAL